MFANPCSNISSAANNPYHQTDYVKISAIHYSGFKHSKIWVIEKYLPIKTGDSLRIDKIFPALEIMREQVLKTRLFNEVSVSVSSWKNNCLEINIKVEERWYLFPLPYLKLSDRNINQWWQDYGHDWRRTIYGINLYHNNLTGRQDKLKISALAGFNQTLSISYETPYLTPARKIGLGFELSQIKSHDINYATLNNKQQFYRGFEITDRYIKAGFSILFQTNPYSFFTFNTSYSKETLSDSIISLNPNFFTTEAKSESLLSLGVRWTTDHRDRTVYPLNGWYASVDYHFYAASSKTYIHQWKAYAARYKTIKTKWSLSNELYSRITSNSKLPYSLAHGLGYKQKLVRGYELYVIDGRNDILLKNSIRFELLNFEIERPLIVLKAFDHIPFHIYLVAFADAGYVSNRLSQQNNSLNNTWQYSTGIGIDIFSYYDFSFSCYYAINAMGEKGIYLHFNN